jgi:hypothetical protein
MSFANLKSKSGSFANLTKEIEKMSSGSKKSDDRFWKPQVDKSGNGFAIIRFLPESEGCELPWAQVWSHAFQGPGGWLIENCPTTKGEKCPVCAANTALWNSGTEADKDVARKQKRKLSYYSNIYVVKDPLNPENEGKVFLYKFGKRIFDKLMAKMQPDENDYDPQPAFNPFDLWKGADFKLKIKQVAGYWNYDDSVFTSPGTLGNYDDERLEEVYNSMHDLASFTSDDQFKTYDELDARLKAVLGRRAPSIDHEVADEESEILNLDIPSSRSNTSSSWTESVDTSSSVTDEDDALSYFAKLAEED